MADFIKCLVSYGIREISAPLFMAKVERVVGPYVNELDSKSIENLLFYLMRSGTEMTPQGASTRNVEILGQVLKAISSKNLLLNHEINDHFAILQVLNQN